MKKLRNLIAVMAMMSMAAVLTGCGDDDDNDDDDGVPNPGGPTIFAPMDEAALTAQNKTYTVQVAGQAEPITLTFPAAGQYQIVQGGTTETGTITGATRDVNTWTMNVTPAAGQDGSQEGVLRLDFSAAEAGTWTFTPTGGQAEAGTFTVTTVNGNPTNGGDNGGTTGPNPGGADLTGQTLQINYTGGGGDKFTFTSPTAVSWENGTDTGTYTYDPATGVFHAQLTGTGQVFDATLTGGTTTVDFRENAGAQPQSFPGTYTFTSN